MIDPYKIDALANAIAADHDQTIRASLVRLGWTPPPKPDSEDPVMMELAVNEIVIGAYYRHRKTGGVYQVLMFATIEATMTPAVIYAAKHDGEVRRWIRPVDEFVDGRFEPVDMTPAR